MARYHRMNPVFPQVPALRAGAVSRGCIRRGSRGAGGVCTSPGRGQSIPLPRGDSGLGCAGNWKTSGSCSSEPSRCGNSRRRSWGCAARWASSPWSGCRASRAGSSASPLHRGDFHLQCEFSLSKWSNISQLLLVSIDQREINAWKKFCGYTQFSKWNWRGESSADGILLAWRDGKLKF